MHPDDWPWPGFPALVARHAARWPDKPAVLHAGGALTYADLAAQGAAVAHLLRDMGVRPGDRVATVVRKTPEALVAFLGCMAAGAMFVPVDCHQPPDIMRQVLRRFAPRVLVVDGQDLPYVDGLHLESLEFQGDAPPSLLIIPAPGQDGDAMGAPEARVRLWREIQGLRLPMPDLDVDHDTPVYCNFTSGSTGVPKGAVATLGAIHWNSRAAIEHFRMTPEDVHLCMMPAFVHPHELFARPWVLGGTISLLEGIAPRSIVARLRDDGVTCFMAVATIYETLIRLHEHHPFRLPALRLAESGGMHAPTALRREVRARLGQPLLPVWGATEATGIAIAMPLPSSPEEEQAPGAMGLALPHYELDVLNEAGDPAPVGEVGQLVVGGPGVCREYYGQPEATAASFPDGRFHTGDLVSRDAAGYFHFHARKQGMLKVGGMRVYPARIEELLHEHPAVAQAVVVRLEDPLRGETPRAIIAPRPGQELTPADIRHWLEPRLHRNAMPRVIDIVESIPKTPGGKIAWRNL